MAARAMAGEALKNRLGLGKKPSFLPREGRWEELWQGAEREGLRLPVTWGAQAVAGCTTAFLNPGWERSAEKMRQEEVECEGAAGWKGGNGCPSISGGINRRMREN